MAYASSDDLISFYDVRDVCQYASDSDEGPIDPSQLPTNPKVTAALLLASAKVDAMCQRGQKYTRAQLLALSQDTIDPQRGQLLRYIVCTLAMAQLVASRLAGAKIEDVVYGFKDVMEILENLRGGAETFDQPEALQAQVPQNTGPDIVFDLTQPSVWNPMFGWWSWRG